MKAKLKYLFEAHYAELCDLASYYVGSNDEAENVVQQVFLNVWEKRNELLSGKRDLKAYLFSSVKNRSLNEIKRVNKSVEIDESIPANIDYGNDYESKDLSQKIDQLIEQLPNKCKYVFKRNRIDDLSYKEIASELGISIKTVESHMSKALKILRELIFKDK